MNNEFLLDQELDPMARCILAVIMTNKKDWKVYPDEIAKRIGISKSTVDKHFKQMEKLGYARFVKSSLGRGKGVEVDRFFADRKIFTNSNFY